jgi:uncharacterized membrane protein
VENCITNNDGSTTCDFKIVSDLDFVLSPGACAELLVDGVVEKLTPAEQISIKITVIDVYVVMNLVSGFWGMDTVTHCPNHCDCDNPAVNNGKCYTSANLFEAEHCWPDHDFCYSFDNGVCYYPHSSWCNEITGASGTKNCVTYTAFHCGVAYDTPIEDTLVFVGGFGGYHLYANILANVSVGGNVFSDFPATYLLDGINGFEIDLGLFSVTAQFAPYAIPDPGLVGAGSFVKSVKQGVSYVLSGIYLQDEPAPITSPFWYRSVDMQNYYWDNGSYTEFVRPIMNNYCCDNCDSCDTHGLVRGFSLLTADRLLDRVLSNDYYFRNSSYGQGAMVILGTNNLQALNMALSFKGSNVKYVTSIANVKLAVGGSYSICYDTGASFWVDGENLNEEGVGYFYLNSSAHQYNIGEHYFQIGKFNITLPLPVFTTEAVTVCCLSSGVSCVMFSPICGTPTIPTQNDFVSGGGSANKFIDNYLWLVVILIIIVVLLCCCACFFLLLFIKK